MGLFADAALAGADEVDEVADFGELWDFLLDASEGVGDGEAFAEEEFVGVAQGVLGFFADAMALHADFVDGADFGGAAVGEHEGGHVLAEFGATADHGEFADAAELVDGDVTAEDGVVFNEAMAGDGGEVGHDDVVTETGVVSDVGVGEEVVVGAEAGDAAILGGAMDGDALAEGVVVADFDAGEAAGPFEVLGFEADGGEGVDFVFEAETGVAADNDMGMEAAAGAEFDMFPNDAVGADLAGLADAGARMNDGGGVNHRLLK